MSSTQEIVDAITAFYKQIVKHPHVQDTALKIPSSSGWGDAIDSDRLRDLGKNDAVIDLLRRLPYLESDGEYERLLVEYETVPIAYTKRSMISSSMERVTPLPSHCVYLTEGVDREGYSLILDVQRGTLTAYSVSGYEISPNISPEEYDNLAPTEQWRAHRTLPATELLNIWSLKYARLVNMLIPNLIGQPTTSTFLSRAETRLQGEQLAQENGPFDESWRPDMQKLVHGIEDEGLRQYLTARWDHVAEVYKCFLRHGWPDAFDKAACRIEVVELERRSNAEERRFLDSNNPDAALFDD